MDSRRGPKAASPRDAARGPTLFEDPPPAPRAAASPPSRAAAEEAPPRVFSVGQLARLLRSELEEATTGVVVGGEIVGFREVSSGHAYFTLRDENEEAAIDCVMYRSAPVRARRLLAEGARLVLKGRVTFWAPRGRVQLVVDNAKPAGRGALLEALEKLKAKLLAEGLFAAERKRPLPKEPRVVGVVTSKEGAALADIVKVAFRRGAARIVVAPAPVQGPDAARLLARALRMLGRHPDVEVVILGRGGGSAEDLSAFNDEDLARAVAASPVPVVSAVGHEVDVTLVDLVADVRAATPSQAAELVVPDGAARLALAAQLRSRLARAAVRALDERTLHLDDLRDALTGGTTLAIGRHRDALHRVERRLAARHPARVLAQARAGLEPLRRKLEAAGTRYVSLRRARPEELATRATVAMATLVASRRAALAERAARLDAMSPLAVLGRGYAVVRTEDGRVVRRRDEVAAGERLHIRLAEGTVAATVDAPDDEVPR
jgi:exodeoxyribonuclease VII large subunit